MTVLTGPEAGLYLNVIFVKLRDNDSFGLSPPLLIENPETSACSRVIVEVVEGRSAGPVRLVKNRVAVAAPLPLSASLSNGTLNESVECVRVTSLTSGLETWRSLPGPVPETARLTPNWKDSRSGFRLCGLHGPR